MEANANGMSMADIRSLEETITGALTAIPHELDLLHHEDATFVQNT